MTNHPVLVPQAEKLINFYGDQILVALMQDDELYVPLRMITEFLGLDWSAQYRRIQRDDILARRGRLVLLATAIRGDREMICLPIDLLPGWLFGISASRVKPELREKLTQYREECFRVLWRTFQGALVPARPTIPAPLEQVRSLALAVASLAEQQMELEQRVDEVDEKAALAIQRISKAADVVGAL